MAAHFRAPVNEGVWYERTGAAPDVLTFGGHADADGRSGRSPGPAGGLRGQSADVGRRAGSYRALEFPRVIPNSDGAGIVDQLGDGVTRLSVASGLAFLTASATAGPSVLRPNISRGRASGDAVPDNVSFAAVLRSAFPA